MKGFREADWVEYRSQKGVDCTEKSEERQSRENIVPQRFKLVMNMINDMTKYFSG